MFSFLKSKAELYPWYGKQPILTFIQKHLDKSGNLTSGGEELPDSKEFNANEQLRFAAGAMDGILIHHTAGTEAHAQKVNELLQLLRKQTAKPSNKTRRMTYLKVMEESVLSIVDDLLDAIRHGGTINAQSLYEEALWFIHNAAHRNVVKFGIALLGLFQCDRELDLLLTIGKHEEFTLFAAVALRNGTENSNQHLFQLAQHVDGWGKIHLVERLEINTPELKEWLLRFGCENSVMNQYLAYTCATKGELKDALSAETIDPELYRGAGIILSALIVGGPAEYIDDYPDAKEAITDYARHSLTNCKSVDDLFTIADILGFLTGNEEEWNERYANNWTQETRSRLEEQCREIFAWPLWNDVLQTLLEKQDSTDLYQTYRLADLLHVDVWENLFQMLQSEPLNSSLFYYLMKTNDRDRVLNLVECAERKLPLQEIASGPDCEIGFGPQYKVHDCLNFILQELDRFEGVGLELIQTALQSPVVRNRNMALKALEGWKREAWEAEVLPVLSVAIELEPEEDVKNRMNALRTS
ncbi:limonene hydroxylase [Brevibacillus ginsengisoli]|uniref:limonene hydroxylase n=1 Tax=Brevibacillus ginsengisoli TaxID=363854 RepID=UPI003CEEE9AE